MGANSVECSSWCSLLPATSRDNSHNCPAPLYPANSVSLYRCCIQLYPLTRRLENWASIAHDSLPRVKGQIRHHLGQESHGQNGFVVDSLFTVRRLYAMIQLNHTLVLPNLSQIMLLTTKLKLQNLSREIFWRSRVIWRTDYVCNLLPPLTLVRGALGSIRKRSISEIEKPTRDLSQSPK